MKHTLFILALFTATIQTFAQSPRIKLNQITKDSLTGSVLISSPTDSGMVYSRDLFISYGADTVLILGGDTLAATSATISSVLSDGVTITGNGTIGSELTVDTTTVIATKQDLDLYYLDSNPDGYTSNTGTVTSVGGTGTVNGISLSGSVTSSGDLTLGGTLSGVDLASQVTGTLPIANGGTGSATQNFVDTSSAQTVGGAKTFSTGIVVNENGDNVDTRFEGDTDANLLFLDASANRVGIGTSSPVAKLNIDGFFNNNTYLDFLTFNDLETDGGGFTIRDATGTGDRTNPGFYFQGKGDFGGNKSYGGVFVAHIDSLATEVNGNIAWYFDARRRFKLGSTVLALTAGTTYFFGNNGTMQLEIKHNNNIFNGNNTTTFNQVSDARDKTNIQELKLGLNLIKNLNPIAYTWQSRDGKRIGIKDVGFLAQDFNAALYSLPQSDYTSLVDIDSDGNYTLNLSQMFPIYVKAIQEQQTIIESQATEIEQLKSQIQLILSEIEQIKNN